MKIKINNQLVNYNCTGSGPTVLLLHGWGQNLSIFEKIQVFLSSNFQVISLDFPGFGLSPDTIKPWSSEDYANLIIEFMQKLKIVKPIIIGHSFGGRVAIYLAAQNLASKVILVSSAGIKTKLKLAQYFKIYSYKFAKNLLKLPILKNYKDNWLAYWQNRLGSTDYKNASSILRTSLVKIVNEDLKGLLPKIKVPVLLIWGDQDTETPLSSAKIMEKLIPDAGLVILKNSGHYAFLEQLPKFLHIVDYFLKTDK